MGLKFKFQKSFHLNSQTASMASEIDVIWNSLKNEEGSLPKASVGTSFNRRSTRPKNKIIGRLFDIRDIGTPFDIETLPDDSLRHSVMPSPTNDSQARTHQNEVREACTGILHELATSQMSVIMNNLLKSRERNGD